MENDNIFLERGPENFKRIAGADVEAIPAPLRIFHS
jgi:hypothetical protein